MSTCPTCHCPEGERRALDETVEHIAFKVTVKDVEPEKHTKKCGFRVIKRENVVRK